MTGYISVAGDVFLDWLTFSVGERSSFVQRRGGAALLTRLLSHSTDEHQRLFGPNSEPQPQDPIYSTVDLISVDTAAPGVHTFGVGPKCIYNQSTWWLPQDSPETSGDQHVLVIEDCGNENKNSGSSLMFMERARPKVLIYKMHRPLATGRLWDKIRRGPFVDDKTQDPLRLIVIVDADDLRAEGIELSRHLSWEKTCEDFVRHIASNGQLTTLVTCAHLIVRFDCDGVIHHRGRSLEPPVLYYSAERAEGEIVQLCSGRMLGIEAAFTAGLTSALASSLAEEPDLPLAEHIDSKLHDSIILGLTSSHRLAHAGFRLGGHGTAPDYPVEIMHGLVPEEGISALRIPTAAISAGVRWSILEDIMGDPAEVAHHIVTDGPAASLGRVPIASFGNMMTADRQEIESFRAINNLIQEYLRVPRKKPLCIGVFGPPGSGKSFGITQVMQAAQGRPVEKLEFNLSQFAGFENLLVAFQLVRDRSLSGEVPLVLFDEFDAAFGDMELGWLRYFLMPMQDGKFSAHSQTHLLGAAIFVFIGGTSSTFAEFAKRIDPLSSSEGTKSVVAKAPDFISRLSGFVDIRGPDKTSEDDRLYPIRRAILLRVLLAQRLPIRGQRLNIDDSVLNAILAIPKYRHGARSLEMILSMSRLSGQGAFERAALPSEAQLNLHVDSEAFMRHTRHCYLPDALRENIGRRLHEVYQHVRFHLAPEAERESLNADEAIRGWEDLSEEFKESSRLQADDIVYKLRMINCYMVESPTDPTDRDAVAEFQEREIEQLAKREHKRFNAERLQRQWRLGDRRNSLHRTSPFLIPWEDLPERWKALDRYLVRNIPQIVRNTGHQIYRLGNGGAQIQGSATS